MKKTFKTKKGYCHLTKTELLVTKNQAVVKEVNQNFDIMQILFAGIALLSFYYCISFIFNGINANPTTSDTAFSPFVIAFLYGAVGMVLLINLLIRRNRTNDYSIPLEAISKIEFKEGSSLIKSFFIVSYTKRSKLVNRIVTVKDETELAIAKPMLKTICEVNF